MTTARETINFQFQVVLSSRYMLYCFSLLMIVKTSFTRLLENGNVEASIGLAVTSTLRVPNIFTTANLAQ